MVEVVSVVETVRSRHIRSWTRWTRTGLGAGSAFELDRWAFDEACEGKVVAAFAPYQPVSAKNPFEAHADLAQHSR